MRLLTTSITVALAAAAVTGCGGGSSAPAATTHAAPKAATAPAMAKVVIQHEVKGCHSWSVNGDAFAASQSVAVAAGGSILVPDNDVMPHKLVQTGGPSAEMVGTAMGKMGAQSTVSFPTAGVYTFTTKAGEDYTSGIKTVGEDNVLTLKVTVA
jgi:plastocyanin